jgi:subtilisin family serine protease
MDGNTAFISRGAEIGASRGMILVNAAGNSGDSGWKYMGAPADAAAVFTVGAVNATKNIASFSSFGPTADNRVKPDVLAQGQSVYVINHTSGSPVTSDGTSFSSPVMTGVVACFWQAFPNLTSTQIMQRIRESADRHSNPDEQYGYGIPNFETAFAAVLNVDKERFMHSTTIYPNPINNSFSIQTNTNDLSGLSIQIYNVLGKKVYEEKKIKSKTIYVSGLTSGIYILKIMNETQQKTIKLVKR